MPRAGERARQSLRRPRAARRKTAQRGRSGRGGSEVKVFVHAGGTSDLAADVWKRWKTQLPAIDRHIVLQDVDWGFLLDDGISQEKLKRLQGERSLDDGPSFLRSAQCLRSHIDALGETEITIYGPVGFGALYGVVNAMRLGYARASLRVVALGSETARSLAHAAGRFFGTHSELCQEYMEAYVALHCDELWGQDAPSLQLDWLRPRSPGTQQQQGKPTVDVIVVHYNRSDMIRRTLDGYLAQTYPHFRLTVVDDGSDATHFSALQDLPNEYPSLDLRVVQKENGYLGAARNHGVELTDADYLVFNDDDNVPMPHMLERLVAAIERSGASIVTCSMRRFEDRGASRHFMGNWHYLGGALAAALFDNCLGDAQAIYRRSVFDSVRFHTQRGIGHEDYELFTRALLLGMHIESVCDALFHYRKDASSMIHTTMPFENMTRHLEAFQAMELGALQPVLMEAALAHALRAQGLLTKQVKSRLKSMYMRLPKPVQRIMQHPFIPRLD